MAYRIQYSPESIKRYPCKPNRKQTKKYKLIVICLILAAALWVRTTGIPDFLLPGDKEVTRAAAETLVKNVKQGSSMTDAVTVFCQEILHGAGF